MTMWIVAAAWASTVHTTPIDLGTAYDAAPLRVEAEVLEGDGTDKTPWQVRITQVIHVAPEVSAPELGVVLEVVDPLVPVMQRVALAYAQSGIRRSPRLQRLAVGRAPSVGPACLLLSPEAKRFTLAVVDGALAGGCPILPDRAARGPT